MNCRMIAQDVEQKISHYMHIILSKLGWRHSSVFWHMRDSLAYISLAPIFHAKLRRIPTIFRQKNTKGATETASRIHSRVPEVRLEWGYSLLLCRYLYPRNDLAAYRVWLIFYVKGLRWALFGINLLVMVVDSQHLKLDKLEGSEEKLQFESSWCIRYCVPSTCDPATTITDCDGKLWNGCLRHFVKRLT